MSTPRGGSYFDPCFPTLPLEIEEMGGTRHLRKPMQAWPLLGRNRPNVGTRINLADVKCDELGEHTRAHSSASGEVSLICASDAGMFAERELGSGVYGTTLVVRSQPLEPVVEPPLFEGYFAPVQRAAGSSHLESWVGFGVEVAAGESGAAVAELDPAIALAVE